MRFLDSIAQVPLKKLFIIAVIFKVVASFLAWLLQSPWFWGFSVPLAFMAAYIFLGFRRDTTQVSDERFGDSCYYLGFIFTISSIAFSLFDIPDLNTSGRLTDVAVRFGAAMISTVVGFFVRVYLVGFRPDVTAAMQSLEEQIIQSANALKTRMDFAQEAFQDYEARIRQAANDADARVQLAIENVGRRASEEMVSALRSMADEVRSLHDVTAGEMRATGQNVATELNNSTRAVAAQLQRSQDLLAGFETELAARLRAVTFPDDYFTQRLSAPVARMVENVAALSRDMNTLTDAVRSSATGLGKAMAKLDVSMEAPQSVRELVDRQETMARQALGALAAGGQAMGSTATAIAKQNEALTRLTKEFSAAQSTQSEVVGATRDILRQLAEGYRANAQGIEGLRTLLPNLEALLEEHRRLVLSVQGAPRPPAIAPPSTTRPADGRTAPLPPSATAPVPMPDQAQVTPQVRPASPTAPSATSPVAQGSRAGFLGRLFGRDRE